MITPYYTSPDGEVADMQMRLVDFESVSRPVKLRDDNSPSDLAAGTAGEHLVCADLLLAGYRAFFTDQNCPYDIAVDLGGRLIRLQVKSTRSPKATPQRRSHIPAYQWHVRRAGKGRRRLYGADDFDLLALVALDIRRVAFLPPSAHAMTIHLRPPGAPGGRHFDDYPFTKAAQDIGVAR